MSDCDCYKIGGPFIAEDPGCPMHGAGGIQHELDALKEENKNFRAASGHVVKLALESDQLRQQLAKAKTQNDDHVAAIGQLQNDIAAANEERDEADAASAILAQKLADAYGQLEKCRDVLAEIKQHAAFKVDRNADCDHVELSGIQGGQLLCILDLVNTTLSNINSNTTVEEHQTLARAIVDMSINIGVTDDTSDLSGPHLLTLCDDITHEYASLKEDKELLLAGQQLLLDQIKALMEQQDGWKLVVKEPTQYMLSAGWSALNMENSLMRDVWVAMVLTSPAYTQLKSPHV